ncbi:hypothetical protein J7I80_05605 [Bacillus sp. ISL-41]|uniref:hypothetical protein n=1 Tax=Bacillus sp. ISL-41 TaxID=2819127 RepID=UPI001BE7BE02|nr:hypothetical protein [Bacillus sp. ISL-41]MBT2641690.1 hypothetical protein [Bacillus sp. ISL-41]
MKNNSIKLILMIAMALIFLGYVVFIFTNPEDTRFLPVLALVSLFGVVLSIILTYKVKNWSSFIFNALPMYILALSSFGYSILGSDNYFKVAFFFLIILYLIRLVKIGWKDNTI